MDRWFFLMADKPEVAPAILDRTTCFRERTSEIMFDKAGKYIDICFTDETTSCSESAGRHSHRKRYARRGLGGCVAGRTGPLKGESP